jgi:hypothetical protein
LELVRDPWTNVSHTSSGGDENALFGIGGQDTADGLLTGDEQAGQVLHRDSLFVGLPGETVHQELTAHLRLSDRQVIKGEDGESHSNLLAFGKGLAGGFLLAESGIPQLSVCQEGRAILALFYTFFE